MATDKENFETWFARPLERLYPNQDFGFIILMSTLPLLERYVRRKDQAAEVDLTTVVTWITISATWTLARSAATWRQGASRCRNRHPRHSRPSQLTRSAREVA
jgi:hypothetical protein